MYKKNFNDPRLKKYIYRLGIKLKIYKLELYRTIKRFSGDLTEEKHMRNRVVLFNSIETSFTYISLQESFNVANELVVVGRGGKIMKIPEKITVLSKHPIVG